MADLSAITGIAGEELDALGKKARETGKQSGLGATQATGAYKVLASQIDVSQIGMNGLSLGRCHWAEMSVFLFRHLQKV